MNVARLISPRVSSWTIAVMLGALGLAVGPTDAQAAPKRCKGGKQHYAGKCRYADEIARLREQAKRQREALAQAKAEAEKEQQQEEDEERRKQDGEACIQARKADTVEGWNEYLDAFPEGLCEMEGEARVDVLEAEAAAPPPPPPPPPPKPKPEPEPEDTGSLDVHPLVWIGGGLALAGGVTWGVAGGISMSRASDLEEQCPDKTCSATQQEAHDDATLSSHVTTIGVVVTAAGLATLGVGLLWPLWSDDTEPAEETTTGAVELAPIFGPTAVGLRARF